MTRSLKGMVWIICLMQAVRGLDYVTGNEHDMGRAWAEQLGMPVYWGLACLVASAAVVVALCAAWPRVLLNAALVSFAINAMFAVQVFDMRMSPVPWPPEDVRLIFDHIAHSALWFLVAGTIWWREGIYRRREELLDKEVIDGG